MGPTQSGAFVLLLASFAVLGCETPETTGPRAETGRRITGGQPTHYETWQGVIGLLFPLGDNRRKECTGTLVAPDLVLSAGHCVYMPSSGVDAVADPENLAISGGAGIADIQYTRARKVVVHPLWDGDVNDSAAVDLALILLKEPLTAIPDYGIYADPLDQGQQGKIVGYGAASAVEPDGKGVHREGDATILGIEDGRIAEIGGPASSCIGDSGGPFFVEADGEWQVAAVTSFGDQDTVCVADHGGYSVALYPYLGWIDETARALTGTGIDLDISGDSQGCGIAPKGRSGSVFRALL